MNANPLPQLVDHGQSYWLDNLTRGKIASGELERRIRDEGLRGITSNPAIFHKAISASHDYDAQIRAAFAAARPPQALLERHGISRQAIVQQVLALANHPDARRLRA